MTLMNTYPPHTTVFERGLGTELWDTEGRRYLDFLCGLAVTSLGHSHPAVAEAVAGQATQLQHVSNLFGTTVGPEVAATIDRLHGGGGKVFFANSGAEANECAIKIARKHGGRGRHVVITTYGSFHGRTLAALAATGQPSKHEPFQPVPEGFRHVALNDLDAMEAAMDDTVAAVFIEPIQGEGGVNPADPEWLRGTAELCRERGVLLMLDEVQTGMCRTGEWWGYQHYDVEPDVVPMAKALGNGMPIGACWATGEAAEAFVPGDHGSTYGGQPLASAAARAVLRVMEDIDAAGLARKQGERLREGLLAREWVDSVRGLGLLLGVEITDAARGGRTAPQIAAQLLDAGLVANGITPTALRMAPPLTVSDAELDEALAICDRVVAGGGS
ncbi:MAG: acetylornithine/succinylornithine family transaminase [Actinomycetota bacterium]